MLMTWRSFFPADMPTILFNFFVFTYPSTVGHFYDQLMEPYASWAAAASYINYSPMLAQGMSCDLPSVSRGKPHWWRESTAAFTLIHISQSCTTCGASIFKNGKIHHQLFQLFHWFFFFLADLLLLQYVTNTNTYNKYIHNTDKIEDISILHLGVMSLLLGGNGPCSLQYGLSLCVIDTPAYCTIRPQQQLPVLLCRVLHVVSVFFNP